jgi:hypothetical protein
MIDNSNHVVIAPMENEIIWRYLSLEKFKSMLERKAVFFCRADRFSDPFEGSVPKREANYRFIEQERIANHNRQPLNLAQAIKNELGTKETHKMLKWLYTVNCWRIGESEADFMWRLYLKSNFGVAIKSNIKSIIQAFSETPENILISKVRYIDYDNDIWYHPIEFPYGNYNFITPLFHKRKEYLHETELRLLHKVDEAEGDENYWTKQEFEKGVFIDISINHLIDEIVLPPTSDYYIEDKVKELLNDFSLDKPVRKSKLSDEPVY